MQSDETEIQSSKCTLVTTLLSIYFQELDSPDLSEQSVQPPQRNRNQGCRKRRTEVSENIHGQSYMFIKVSQSLFSYLTVSLKTQLTFSKLYQDKKMIGIVSNDKGLINSERTSQAKEKKLRKDQSRSGLMGLIYHHPSCENCISSISSQSNEITSPQNMID